jgi:predicted RNA-binding Zn-ribbon protein involved in translation (DUF1610 family)
VRARLRVVLVIFLVGVLARGASMLVARRITDRPRPAAGDAQFALEHLESTVRSLVYADTLVAVACGAVLAYAAHRFAAWPCPRCGEPFLRHRRRGYGVVALAFTLALVPFAMVCWAVSAIGWWMLLFLPRTVYQSVNLFLLTYGCSVVIQRQRYNYAKRNGDPEWRKKLHGYCVHCGLPAWSPSLPENR